MTNTQRATYVATLIYKGSYTTVTNKHFKYLHQKTQELSHCTILYKYNVMMGSSQDESRKSSMKRTLKPRQEKSVVTGITVTLSDSLNAFPKETNKQIDGSLTQTISESNRERTTTEPEEKRAFETGSDVFECVDSTPRAARAVRFSEQVHVIPRRASLDAAEERMVERFRRKQMTYENPIWGRLKSVLENVVGRTGDTVASSYADKKTAEAIRVKSYAFIA